MSQRRMDIGIIGTGNIGSILARRLTALGHQVRIANSRGPSTLTALANETGAKAVTSEEAALAEDIVIVSIPQGAITALSRHFENNETAVIVDTGNYYPSRDGRIAGLEGDLTESQWVALTLGRPVIKAFNNIGFISLDTRADQHVSLSVAGDDEDAKKQVLALVNSIGFVALDAGSLADSWRQQPGTPAYFRDLDVTALKAALAQADVTKKAEYRAAADEAARPYFQKA